MQQRSRSRRFTLGRRRDAAKVIETYKHPFVWNGTIASGLSIQSLRERSCLLDGWRITSRRWLVAMRLLLDEMRSAYSSRQSQPWLIPLPELNYTDYAQWQIEMIASSEGERLGLLEKAAWRES